MALKVAERNVEVKPSLVPSLNKIWPRLEALPTVRPVAPCSDKLANVGLEVVAMSCTRLITPPLAEKFVLLKVAMPLVTPSAAALSSVIAVPEPELLLIVRAPVKLFTDETPAEPPPPPLVRHVAQDN